MLTACSDPIDAPPKESGELHSAPDDAEATDTGELFTLTPSQRDALERQATQGDGEAAFRLSRYWGMAGGDSGLAGDPKNGIEEERWLRVATDTGHEQAKFELAIVIARRDCATARKMLAEIETATSNQETRSSARDWLKSDYLCGRR